MYGKKILAHTQHTEKTKMDWYKIRYMTDWKQVSLITLIGVFILGIITISVFIYLSVPVPIVEPEINLTPTCEDFSRSLRGCESFYCEENESSYIISFNPPQCVVIKTTDTSETICSVLVRERMALSEIPIGQLQTSPFCQTTSESILG